jgi:hypothetical protein
MKGGHSPMDTTELEMRNAVEAIEKFWQEQSEKMEADPIGYSKNRPDFTALFLYHDAIKNYDRHDIITIGLWLQRLNYYGSTDLREAEENLRDELL